MYMNLSDLLSRFEPKENKANREELHAVVEDLRSKGLNTTETPNEQDQKEREQRVKEVDSAMQEIFDLASQYSPSESGSVGIKAILSLNEQPVTIQIASFHSRPEPSTGLEKSVRILVNGTESGKKKL